MTGTDYETLRPGHDHEQNQLIGQMARDQIPSTVYGVVLGGTVVCAEHLYGVRGCGEKRERLLGRTELCGASAKS